MQDEQCPQQDVVPGMGNAPIFIARAAVAEHQVPLCHVRKALLDDARLAAKGERSCVYEAYFQARGLGVVVQSPLNTARPMRVQVRRGTSLLQIT
jgi:hypothetical protein